MLVCFRNQEERPEKGKSRSLDCHLTFCYFRYAFENMGRNVCLRSQEGGQLKTSNCFPWLPRGVLLLWVRPWELVLLAWGVTREDCGKTTKSNTWPLVLLLMEVCMRLPCLLPLAIVMNYIIFSYACENLCYWAEELEERTVKNNWCITLGGLLWWCRWRCVWICPACCLSPLQWPTSFALGMPLRTCAAWLRS